ncbi:hypothetical protein G6O67_002258 [Ophiocordyceps sinensis]|uniref:Beta-ketoacyl synthase n=1 Tax=Ophiocordyceps sinensis TaxID=72228 RepID=A0A8H4PTW5_9HYPO|nr:hypothetical protein G6O67_002258 [Ophiocordyceps sinensis]
MLSPSGRCRMWDEAADGYGRGEGVACVVLKTLSQALKDGDEIESIIRETGVNQDGRTQGITIPSRSAQAALIRATPRQAELLSFDLDWEAKPISEAFFGGRQRSQDDDGDDGPLHVGSIKTIIGHTEGAAGIAGFIKASLAVQHAVIPPNLLFESLSPFVAPFYKKLRIVDEARPWPALAPGQPRRASVNSFGFGGTNAHAIVERFGRSGPTPLTPSVCFGRGQPGPERIRRRHRIHAQSLPAAADAGAGRIHHRHRPRVNGMGFAARAAREGLLGFDLSLLASHMISEDDLHALFAEAVVVGRPERHRGEDVELLTGMPYIDPALRGHLPLADDPRFGYYMLQLAGESRTSVRASVGDIKERLTQAKSMDEVVQLIIDGLSEKPRRTLQIGAGDAFDANTSLLDHGIDSISATAVRNWFSEMLHIDVPQLKILRGASIWDLATEEASRIPSSLIPQARSSDETPGSDGSSATP